MLSDLNPGDKSVKISLGLLDASSLCCRLCCHLVAKCQCEIAQCFCILFWEVSFFTFKTTVYDNSHDRNEVICGDVI